MSMQGKFSKLITTINEDNRRVIILVNGEVSPNKSSLNEIININIVPIIIFIFINLNSVFKKDKFTKKNIIIRKPPNLGTKPS